MARIVMATFGSFGDVYPYIALGIELRRRGHAPVLAAAEAYRDLAVSHDIEFAHMRPDVDPSDRQLLTRIMEPKRGAEVIVREIVMPALRNSYADLEKAVEGADLLLSHVLTYAAPVLGEKTGLPWMSTVLSPMVFCSAFEPPAFAPIPWLASFKGLGPGVNGVVLKLLKRISHSWSEPVRALRAELGLPPGADPLFEGQHSPKGGLALFSPVFGPRQRDWPEKTLVCGFAFLDEDYLDEVGDLEEFLEAGQAPVVFTLGSSAVHALGTFWKDAAEAARIVGRRAVFVAGPDVDKFPGATEHTRALRVAPFHRLFPRSAAVVHVGGVGTTAQALRAGTPQVIVPYAHDQFDNANRVQALGCGVRHRGERTAASLAEALKIVLEGGAPGIRNVAESLRKENGLATACEAIDAFFWK